MKRKHENLILAAAKFAEDWWSSYEESSNMLTSAISNKMIDKIALEQDFLDATADKNFDWIAFATQSELLREPGNYSNKEILNYVLYLFEDYLYPERTISDEQLKELETAVTLLLKKQPETNPWLLSYDIHNQLKKQQLFENLAYYNLRKIAHFQQYEYYSGEQLVKERSYYNVKGSNNSVNIERKPIESKQREIGYLRYSENIDKDE